MTSRGYFDLLVREWTGQPQITTRSVSGTVPIDSNVGRYVLTLTGPVTIGAPTGSPIGGQDLYVVLLQDPSGSRTVSWNTAYRDVPALAAGAAGTRASFKFRYDGIRWQFLAGSTAFA